MSLVAAVAGLRGDSCLRTAAQSPYFRPSARQAAPGPWQAVVAGPLFAIGPYTAIATYDRKVDSAGHRSQADIVIAAPSLQWSAACDWRIYDVLAVVNVDTVGQF